jgi:hypothetical protein
VAEVDVVIAMGLLILVAGVAAVLALTVGGVPDRKPPTAPRMNGDFDIWLFF